MKRLSVRLRSLLRCHYRARLSDRLCLGQRRNRIADEERVDCSLMGQDGRIYLFRGDQFSQLYADAGSSASIPDLADLNPTPVAGHWGGLSNVRYAFIRKGVTYLLEAPAEDGAFRYNRYFGVDYTRPTNRPRLHGDFSFWNIPAEYIDRG